MTRGSKSGQAQSHCSKKAMANFQDSDNERWHNRFLQQSQWTESVRIFLVEHLQLQKSKNILEIGCGTGVITADMASRLNASLHGLDLNFDFLRKAANVAFAPFFCCGNAYSLPYPDQIFDVCFCHFLLLWLSDPIAALIEMARVVKKGGWIIIMAEPDYGHRIDYPPVLEALGKQQEESLKTQGANPSIGRSIAHLLNKIGLQQIKYGLMGGQWGIPLPYEQLQSEWQTLRSDLKGTAIESRIDELIEVDRNAWEEGYRVLYVPTFYAWGKV
jgi:ubiquinone/menaquinone biosynthesis C-methylase UbiE